jgi:hypothetical protein
MPLHLPQCLLSPADRCGGAEAIIFEARRRYELPVFQMED